MKKNSIKSLQKLLAFKSEETTLRFLARLQGWVESKPLTQKSLLSALNTILKDLHHQEAENAKKQLKINLNSIKNPALKKYASEILELHRSGHGVRYIEKFLQTNHNAKISYSSIHRFLRQQEKNNG
jgi:hypothetical protein